MPRATLTLPYRTITMWLVAIVGIFVAANIWLVVFVPYFSLEVNSGLLGLINMNSEVSLPTWYAQTLLLAASGLLAVIAVSAAHKRGYWLALAAIFLFLSIDEGAAIHEMFNGFPARELLGDAPFARLFHYGWTGVYSVVVVATLVLFWRFLWSLDVTTRRLFVASGGLFVLGALGFEAIGGWIAAGGAEFSQPYMLASIAEESFELLGVCLFLYALMRRLASDQRVVSIQFRSRYLD